MFRSFVISLRAPPKAEVEVHETRTYLNTHQFGPFTTRNPIPSISLFPVPIPKNGLNPPALKSPYKFQSGPTAKRGFSPRFGGSPNCMSNGFIKRGIIKKGCGYSGLTPKF